MLLILKVQELTNSEDFKLRLLRIKLPLLLDENLPYHQLLSSMLLANFKILISSKFEESNS